MPKIPPPRKGTKPPEKNLRGKPKKRKPLYRVTTRSNLEYLTTNPVLPSYGKRIEKLNPEIFALTTR